MDYNKLIKMITKKNRIPRLIFVTAGIFILALNFNVFLLTNDLVIGGTSGLAIIFKKICNINPNVFIYTANTSLIIISFLVLGANKTSKTIYGSLLYPLMITLTEPLAKIIIPYVTFDSIFLTIIIAGLLHGLGNGIIYKSGFTTGGGDIIMQIINKYFKIPVGKSNFITNSIIIVLGGLVFGITKAIYSIIIIYITSTLVDKIIIGISDSKMFFIYTEKEQELKEMIYKELKAGITIFNAQGGFSKQKNDIIMCVVPTRDYFLFKETVLSIDPNAFFVITDCYEVMGGVKKLKMPFI